MAGIPWNFSIFLEPVPILVGWRYDNLAKIFEIAESDDGSYCCGQDFIVLWRRLSV